MQDLEHPSITNARVTGYPCDYEEIELPPCPNCGSTDYDDIYQTDDCEVVGCSDCIRRIEPSDYWERVNGY